MASKHETLLPMSANVLDISEGEGYLCEWVPTERQEWETSCEQTFIFMKDGPEENDFLFCPFCGCTINAH